MVDFAPASRAGKHSAHGPTHDSSRTETVERQAARAVYRPSASHPFYTGKQRIMDSAGRVEKFNQRFKNFGGSSS